MILMTTIDLPLDYAADASDGNFRGGRKTEFVSERQFLRGTETITAQEDDFSSFEPGTVNGTANGTVTVVDYEHCNCSLLFLPISMGFFAIFLVYCCCLKMQTQTRIAGSTRNEQEQREIQRRQLPVMASMRRRERELHRIRLETNARLEKIKGRLAEETNARRILLFEKFKKAGLEKVSDAIFVMRSSEVLLWFDFNSIDVHKFFPKIFILQVRNWHINRRW